MTPPLSSLQIMLKEQVRNSNSTLIMCHYPGLDSTSYWLCHKEKLLPPIRTTTATQIRAVRCHQYFCACSSRVDSQGNLRWHHKMLANGTVVIIIFLDNYLYVSLRKQQTFGDATTGFPTKWCLRNERRNLILMMRHYPDLSNDASPKRNFCAHLSDVTWQGNQW